MNDRSRFIILCIGIVGGVIGTLHVQKHAGEWAQAFDEAVNGMHVTYSSDVLASPLPTYIVGSMPVTTFASPSVVAPPATICNYCSFNYGPPALVAPQLSEPTRQSDDHLKI